MTQYLNAMAPIEGTDGKTRFHKIGVAFINENSKAVMSIKLFAAPIHGEIVLFEPKNTGAREDQELTE